MAERRALVTGVAGFIGSHLAEELLGRGCEVVGVDCFTDYYDRGLKEGNLAGFRDHPAFRFVEADLLDADLEGLLEGVDLVFHQAAQAGVRASWGESFEIYTENNIRGTQRLLEASKGASLESFVYASSSSVYGDSEELPLSEDQRLRPVSPYGVSKLAGENLCYLYHVNFGLPAVSLRYFTVYGPRQRPDMAFHKFGRALLLGEKIFIYGDGEQSRDFTYIDDVVRANILASERGGGGEIYNIGGGSRVVLNEVIATMEEIVGKRADLSYVGEQKGDVRHTAADIARARKDLGYSPRVALREGLTREMEWLKRLPGVNE